MEKLTIKLLHERRSSNSRRKVDGRSGKLYNFLWSDEHKAYCFTTSSQEEADDLFNSQGRAMGSYFAPVITIAPKAVEAKSEEAPLSDDVVMALIDRGIDLPVDQDVASVAKALIAAHEKGMEAGRAGNPQPVEVASESPFPAATGVAPDPAPVRKRGSKSQQSQPTATAAAVGA